MNSIIGNSYGFSNNLSVIARLMNLLLGGFRKIGYLENKAIKAQFHQCGLFPHHGQTGPPPKKKNESCSKSLCRRFRRF